MTTKQDNSTYRTKVAIRKAALTYLHAEPVVMETHGGAGALFDACYAHLPAGVVFEMDTKKAARLGKQRPTWAVYRADCVEALQAGAGAHLTVDLLDVDPYGSPWGAIDAFFTSERPRAGTLAVVVNDGLRQAVAMGRSWATGDLAAMVEKYGNDLHEIYLSVAGEMLENKAAQAGYRLRHFAGYYTGHNSQMTHYLGIFESQES